jgi:alpha/beta superfamily hydrolase
MSPASVERLSIEGPTGTLETLCETSDEEVEVRRPRYAVVCHPHPLFGGTMDNKVVTSLARALREVGIPTLRFNFRGVGGSAGVFDSGIGETEDARAVVIYGAARWPGRELVLAGFSFGAFVALRLAQNVPVSQLVTVAPAVARFDFSPLKVPACPWLVVQGDADEVVTPQAVFDWVAALKPQPQLKVMPGVGHFFHGRLLELRAAVIETVRDN